MKIRIDRAELASALKKVMGAADARSDKAYLHNVLMEADDETLVLSTTDLDISARTRLTCDVEEDGAITTPVKNFQKALAQMTEDDVLLERTDNERLRVRAGSVDCVLVGGHPDDYPALFFGGEAKLGLEADHFLRLLEYGGFCASHDTERPGLTGVHVVRRELAQLTAESTDGHLAARVSVELDAWDHNKETFLSDGVTLPTRGVRVLTDLVDADGPPVDVALAQKQIVFTQGADQVSMRPIGANFPDLSTALPEVDATEWDQLILDTGVLSDAMKLAKIFRPKKTQAVRFSASGDGLEVYVTNPDLGESLQVIPAEWSGGESRFVGNWSYVHAALSHVDGEEVRLWLHQEKPSLSPVVILDPDDEELTLIVMPQRA